MQVKTKARLEGISARTRMT